MTFFVLQFEEKITSFRLLQPINIAFILITLEQLKEERSIFVIFLQLLNIKLQYFIKIFNFNLTIYSPAFVGLKNVANSHFSSLIYIFAFFAFNSSKCWFSSSLFEWPMKFISLSKSLELISKVTFISLLSSVEVFLESEHPIF